MQVSNREWSFAQISVNLGKEWREMDAPTKAPFVQLNAMDKLRYKNQMIRYKAGEKFAANPRSTKDEVVDNRMMNTDV